MSSSGSCGITSRRGRWDGTRCHRSEGRARLKDSGVTGLQGPAAATPCPGTRTCQVWAQLSPLGEAESPRAAGLGSPDKAPVPRGAILALQSSPGGLGAPGHRAELPEPRDRAGLVWAAGGCSPYPSLHSSCPPHLPEQRRVPLASCILNTFLYLRNNDPRPADNLCPISARCRAAT